MLGVAYPAGGGGGLDAREKPGKKNEAKMFTKCWRPSVDQRGSTEPPREPDTEALLHRPRWVFTGKLGAGQGMRKPPSRPPAGEELLSPG